VGAADQCEHCYLGGRLAQTLAVSEVLSELTNREIALLIWMGTLAVGAVVYRPARQTLGPLWRACTHPKIFGSVLALLAYTGLVVLVVYRFGLWQWWMLKDTIFWLFGTAIVAFLDIPKATQADGFFKRIILDSVKLTVVLEFVSNLYAFNLLVELLLLPTLTFLGALASVAGSKTEFRPVKRLLDGMLAVFGFGLLIYLVVSVATGFHDFATLKHFEDFMVPVVLTITVLPFYLLAVYASYDSLFTRLDMRLRGTGLTKFAKARAFLACGLRLATIRQFAKDAALHVGAARTRGARRIPSSGRHRRRG
jgi:hypothetical protein